MSSTRRVSAPCTDRPFQLPDDGIVPAEGLNPTRPQHAAGIRIEPAPSLAVARPTMPAATAAAEPPEEPPGVRQRSQGLRVAPVAADSVKP